ncbi:AraC-like DNA-binding protein [Paenibacillus anaericanus]|uniref:response regulator transcription factor n=1 Tax=Paenibacillus anaericanus TaxID=170367 RepID=UPI002788F0AC|nr:response regulator transcription factor [Paenibacillus anaericanus]MDQ0091556.1 AraC-like DNA-binding protein [Paenibacillus anaericanus]
MVFELRGTRFFEDDFPIYLNREVEAFHLREHIHDFVELCLVEEGQGHHFIDKKSYPVQKGDVFLLPVGTVHVFRPVSARTSHPLVVCNCIFKLEALQELLNNFPADSRLYEMITRTCAGEGYWYQFRDNRNRLNHLFNEAYLEYYNRGSNYRVLIRSLVLQIFIVLDRLASENDIGSYTEFATMVAERMQNALELLHSNYKEHLTLEMLAEKAFMSVRQFQIMFKQATGKTFNRYIQHVRILKSCELLVHTDWSVRQIAEEVGYSDMKFFHALFRKITSESPLRYRQTYKKNTNCKHK